MFGGQGKGNAYLHPVNDEQYGGIGDQDMLSHEILLRPVMKASVVPSVLHRLCTGIDSAQSDTFR